MKDVLIVDDEEAICEALVDLLDRNGITADSAGSRSSALEKLRSAEFEVVLLDLRMPEVQGLSLLREIRDSAPRLPVIVITAFATVETAVEAMKQGAVDFITKPIDQAQLLRALEPALRLFEEEAEASSLFIPLSKDLQLVCRDPRTVEVVTRAKKVAASELPVLITGETGVGKEVFARLLHEYGPRKSGPFVKVNCAAIPKDLFESDLFGHMKGAFSGAIVDKPGRVELAEGGTLFLDEIGELPFPAQAKLLQFLQDHTFERVGDVRTRKADVRVVSATNRDLRDAFREDLLNRLGIALQVPALRERAGDIEPLARYFLERQPKKVQLAPDVIAALRAHSWRGNVRELARRIAEAVALSDGPTLSVADILPAAPSTPTIFEERDQFEKRRILETLERTKGNRTEAAKVLGISRRGLQKKLKEFGIQ
jgi:DNA-binding NtrC family response regulator